MQQEGVDLSEIRSKGRRDVEDSEYAGLLEMLRSKRRALEDNKENAIKLSNIQSNPEEELYSEKQEDRLIREQNPFYIESKYNFTVWLEDEEMPSFVEGVRRDIKEPHIRRDDPSVMKLRNSTSIVAESSQPGGLGWFSIDQRMIKEFEPSGYEERNLEDFAED